jgi:signal transduction histidine kinase
MRLRPLLNGNATVRRYKHTCAARLGRPARPAFCRRRPNRARCRENSITVSTPRKPATGSCVADDALYRALDTVLLGVLILAAPRSVTDTASVADAYQQSAIIGRRYAARGMGATAVVRVYQQLLARLRQLVPPSTDLQTVEVLLWDERLRRASDDLLLVALVAFERERRVRSQTDRQRAQDQAVQHMAATIRDTLHQSLSLLCGYTELLAARPDAAPELRELLGEILKAGERLAADAHRLAAARRYVMHSPSPGAAQLDLELAVGPGPTSLPALPE